MRVFVPATTPALRTLRDDGFPAPFDGYAVTPALREWYAGGHLEELEYAASAAAAAAALRLLHADPDAPRRRIVVAAELPDAAVRPAAGSAPSVVRVVQPLTLDAVVSVHVDDDEARDDVVAAVRALDAAAAGDPDAQFTVEAVEGHDLLWYDVSELDDLIV
jgi:hypothetical protein